VPVGALATLIGSTERLELAVRNGSAAQTLGVGIGDIVRVYSARAAG
jgi:S-adenosyl-L-methionine hydrolase (adenosine-forming)